MRYLVEVAVGNDPKQSLELDSLPPIPLAGDTVALQSGNHTSYGVVRHRHFEFTAPNICRVSLVCVPENR